MRRNVGYGERHHFSSSWMSKCRLGGTPMMELMIAAGKAVPKLQLEHGLAVDRVYTGSFMTSLDMAGLPSWIIASFISGNSLDVFNMQSSTRFLDFYHEG